MTATTRAIATLLFCLCTIGVPAAELNEKSVHEFLQVAEQAVAEQNIDSLGDALSQDANITINITSDGTTQVITMARDKYLDSLEQSWELFDDYSYSRTLLSTRIFADRAEVETRVDQSFSVDGENFRQSSHEKSVIKLIDGKLQLTRLESSVNL